MINLKSIPYNLLISGRLHAGRRRILFAGRSSPAGERLTHRLAMPALRTAVEMALTAVQRALRSWVSSPVPRALVPSSITKRVRVTTLVSKVERSVMLAMQRRQQQQQHRADSLSLSLGSLDRAGSGRLKGGIL